MGNLIILYYNLSLPVSCHFQGCKVPLFMTVSVAISSDSFVTVLSFQVTQSEL